MNSEELELSLRTEFESYLKGVFAGMQQDVADFQKNFEAEFEKHKAQMDEAFRNLSTRFDSDISFDKGFTEAVVEHLELARDDGAQLTAHAFAEAQKLDDPNTSASSASYDRLRDAINDISGQLTQSAILKSLVDHVSGYTPRGAFFIVKHDNFVCWRKFDRHGHADDEQVRAIHFPLEADTLLAEAVRTLNSSNNSSASHSGDGVYLDALGYGRPDRMFAIPLMARGRGVAVLYADRGDSDGDVNVEAIESLVRVAGLTVELRAAAVAQPAATEPQPTVSMPAEVTRAEEVETSGETWAVSEPAAEESTVAEPEMENAVAEAVEEYAGVVAVEEVEQFESESAVSSVPEPKAADYFTSVPAQEETVASESSHADVAEPAAQPVNDFAFASSDSYKAAETSPEPAEEYAYSSETSNGNNGHAYEPTPEPVVEVAAAQPTTSRLRDRHVELPIEVADDERRLHNDARRFARLLVSEIKLYNEQKVHEGRDAADLYDRLREAIDRSREMYEKRIQPQVAAKFDYFHYELVSNLAEGNDQKLGTSYPGASV